MVITWLKSAREDLHNIYKFIAKDSEYYAKKVLNDFFDATEILNLFPKSGRVVPETDREELREIIIYSYRLIYKIKENEILVMVLLNSKQLIKRTRLKE